MLASRRWRVGLVFDLSPRIEGQSVVEMCGSQEDEVLVFAVFCGWLFQTLLGLKSRTPQECCEGNLREQARSCFLCGLFFSLSVNLRRWRREHSKCWSSLSLSLSEEGLYKVSFRGKKNIIIHGVGSSWLLVRQGSNPKRMHEEARIPHTTLGLRKQQCWLHSSD